MKNSDMPAIPCQPLDRCGNQMSDLLPGLTKLEKISARIMAGFAVDPDIDTVMAQEVVKSAVMLAYALPAELEK